MEQNNTHPLVAIKCLVYNHDPYLRDCLNGFVMQQTDFPFVAIVHDDASTDKSADIIREYAAKYPDIIKPICETENQYSKSDGSLGRVMNTAIDATGAKYVAVCEGDDYWTDPRKLQKQVDFLETHPDYGFVGTRYQIVKDGEFLVCETLPALYECEGEWELYGDIFESVAIYGPPTRTCTMMYRRHLLISYRSIIYGDYLTEAVLASQSKFARLSIETACYRVHSGSLTQSKQMRVNYAEFFVGERRILNQLFPNVCHFDEDELTDYVLYAKLKDAILRGDYRLAKTCRNEVRTSKYRKKTYCRYLRGYFSFLLLRCTMA